MVVPLGFEPKLTVSKTAVLPLHHGTVAGWIPKAEAAVLRVFFAKCSRSKPMLNSCPEIQKYFFYHFVDDLWTIL